MPETLLQPASLDLPESTVSDYFALLKPKVMSLVVFTGLAGFITAPHPANFNLFLSLIGLLCLAVGAGASGAINMWYDRDIDVIMNRTKDRPIPQNRISPDNALAFGLVLSLLSVMVMGLAVNWTAAGLLAFANVFYIAIYTMGLKRRTPQNIVIGGAAGAFPPMIGWAIVTGDISLYPILQFMIIFMWTPPHFWALSLFANDDYKRANIPMMTVTHGEHYTKINMLIYTILLLPLTLAPWLLGFESVLYGVAAFILSGLFLLSCLRVMQTDDLKPARIMFGYSIFYLFALFLAMMIL